MINVFSLEHHVPIDVELSILFLEIDMLLKYMCDSKHTLRRPIVHGKSDASTSKSLKHTILYTLLQRLGDPFQIDLSNTLESRRRDETSFHLLVLLSSSRLDSVQIPFLLDLFLLFRDRR